ncbi:hypothetical protein F9L07_28390 [Pimelobacter simplex]|uniref:Uncharacterized protein n=1 Tax=Nocardioides simplex TaxID=2045 RepID=A0A7J5DQK9_NOCSI|nr:hypothetical protein [Pimelobacter simplex]KAB2806954.1 hypothetical protein F9L07_28390 [Pimelobacter simplex]
MAEVLTTATQNVRAAALVLDQAERVGLPDPVSLTATPEYDTDVSRGRAHVELLFTSHAALGEWATHLQAEIVEGPGSYALPSRTWHYGATGEWLGVQLSLTAVTRTPAPSPAGAVTDVR